MKKESRINAFFNSRVKDYYGDKDTRKNFEMDNV